MWWTRQSEYFAGCQRIFGDCRVLVTESSQRGFILNACEFVLAGTLRMYCDKTGKETDTDVSAKIFRVMGHVYRLRSPDKACLIKAVALTNAALCRNNSKEVENYLRSLHLHVLQLAGAVKTSADLVKQSELCGFRLEYLRTQVDSKMKVLSRIDKICDETKLRKADEMEHIQEWITQEYVAIMREIMGFCVETMGSPPCRYALVAMGSLAKLEITPYSDFENCILLERGVEAWPIYHDIVDYFSWAAVLFQIILVGIKEMIVRFLSIPLLNDPKDSTEDWFYDVYTPCGVCPDGLNPQASKNPVLNDAKLTRSVGEMLKYIDPRYKASQDPRLADMLTRTKLVAGEQAMLVDFQNEAIEIDARAESHRFKMEMLQECLKKFSTSKKLVYVQSSREVDIKRIVYRSTTIFVSVLGRCHGIYEASTFDIVKELRRKKAISEEFEVDLLFALAVACELRLRVYSEWRSQNDMLEPFSDVTDSTLRNLMGDEVSLAYFQIACELQNMAFCLSSKQSTSEPNAGDASLEHKLNKVRIYFSLSLYGEALDLCNNFGWMDISKENRPLPKCLYLIAMCLYKQKKHKDALEYFKVARVEFKTYSQVPNVDMLDCLNQMMCCCHEMGDLQQAFEYLPEVRACAAQLPIPSNLPRRNALFLRIFLPSTGGKAETGYAMASQLHVTGMLYLLATKTDDALSCFQQELALTRRQTARVNDPQVAKCYMWIGKVLLLLRRQEEALRALRTAKAMYENCRGNQDRKLCKVENLLGAAYLRVDNDLSLSHFEEEWRLRHKYPRELDLEKAASCFYNIGCLHSYAGRKQLALMNLKAALDHIERLPETRSRQLMKRVYMGTLASIKK